MICTGSGYRILPDIDPERLGLIAVDANDVTICGAYRPAGLNDWRIFLTKLVVDATGLPQPHKAHVCSRDDAVRWVELIATLYTRSVR